MGAIRGAVQPPRAASQQEEESASHRLVGKTDSGRLLTLLVRETDDIGTWEVVNGWDASKGEKTLYERRAR